MVMRLPLSQLCQLPRVYRLFHVFHVFHVFQLFQTMCRENWYTQDILPPEKTSCP